MASKKIDKVALAELIRSLDGINNDQRADLLQLLNDRKRYGLVWEEHSEDVEEQLREKLPVLKEVCERRILSDDAESPNHILIEGDNLHALIALTYTHEGKVDVIYIDPPYNTGNKDFIYNDSFVDAEDGFRHSKWLSFMEKRLKIAKKILKDDGSVFISIDEHELYDLKILCDEIFGERNFIGQWNWYKSATPPALSLKIKRNLEYIVGYEKNRSSIKYQGVQKTSSSNDPITKPQNTLKELCFPPLSLNIKSKQTHICPGVYGTSKFPNELLDDLYVENGKNRNMVRFRNRFIWLQSTLDEEIKKGTKFDLSKQLVISYKRSAYNPEVPPNYIDENVNVDTTEEAGKQLVSILGEDKFDYPKPISLIKYLLNFRQSSLILDFFAGSGTTLHATMQLNEEDGGKRQCILVTNNENNICEEVTYERNKRVIEGYTTPKGEQVEGLKNNNLRYYKIDFVDRDSSVTAMKKLMVASTDLLCIKQDLYEEKDTFGSITLKPNIARYFNDGVKQMLIIYNTDAIESLVAEIEKMPEDTNIITYVFSTNNYPLNADFEDVADKVSLCALPAAINNAYRNVLPNKLTPKSDDHETETISGE